MPTLGPRHPGYAGAGEVTVRAGLGVTADGPMLEVLDAAGETRVALGMNKGVPELTLFYATGKAIWRAP